MSSIGRKGFLQNTHKNNFKPANTQVTGNRTDHIVTHGGRVFSGGGNDHIIVTPDSGNTDIHAGSGNDVIDIYKTDHQGNIQVDGGDGYDEVNITDLTTTDTNWDVDYNADGDDSNFSINVGDSSYVVGTDVESLSISNANGDTVLDIDNVSEWLSSIQGEDSGSTGSSYSSLNELQGLLTLNKPALPQFKAL